MESAPLLTRPVIAWLGGFIVIGTLGLVSFDLLFILFALVPLFLWLLQLYGFRRLIQQIEVYRRSPGGVYEGANYNCEFYLTNNSDWPIFSPVIRERIPFAEEFRAETRYGGIIRPGETIRCRYNLECRDRFGHYTLGPVSIRMSDPVGLSRIPKVFDRYFPITLYPRWEPLSGLSFFGGRRHFADQPKSNARTARGQDIYGVREYERGDPVRHIHWRSVARKNELYVKQFEMPASRTVSIFLDLHQERRRGLGARTTLRITVRLAASVARHGIETGHRVGLHGEGQRSLYIPPRAGDHQLRTILETLVDLKQEGTRSLDELLLERLNRLDDQATVILVVPATRLDPDRYVRSLSILHGRRAGIGVFLIDDAEMVRYDGTMEEYERNWSLNEVQQAFRAQGAWCHIIDPKRPFSEQITEEEINYAGRV